MAVSIHELQAREAFAPSNLNNSLAFTIFPRGRGATLCPRESPICQEGPSLAGRREEVSFGRCRVGRESPLASARDSAHRNYRGNWRVIIPTNFRENSGLTSRPSLMKFLRLSRDRNENYENCGASRFRLN